MVNVTEGNCFLQRNRRVKKAPLIKERLVQLGHLDLGDVSSGECDKVELGWDFEGCHVSYYEVWTLTCNQ